VFDDDRGRDEKVGNGGSKVSTFCADPEMDLWLDIEYKGKEAGKLHFTSKWEPTDVQPSAEEHGSMMEEAQAAIMALSKRKNELEDEYNGVNATIEEHEATYEEKLAAVQGDIDESAYTKAVCAAHAAYDETMARIQRDRELAEEGKGDFEKSIADKVRDAAEARDAKNEEIEAFIVKSDEDREQANTDAAAGEESAKEAKEARLAALEEELAGVKAGDDAEYERVAGEIKEIAERLLEINEKLQEKLTALTNL
jgi:hypothetical protein